METDLISLMFSQFTGSLESFISNDISVVLLAMLSLMFTVFAFVKIREIFNMGMTEDEINAKTAREPLMPEEYQMRLGKVRDEFYENGSKDE